MLSLQNILVTKIVGLPIVSPQKGRQLQMTNRKNYGISFCESGQITYFMNGKQVISAPGKAILLPKGATYSWHGDKDGIFYVINFQCENFPLDEITVIPLQNPQYYLKQYNTLKKSKFSTGAQLECFSIFYKILHSLSCEGDASQDRLASILQYIERRLSDPTLSNEVLAQELNISEVYMRKLFLRQYKRTPKQYILDMRMQLAKQLLVESPFTVSAISEKCGFTNPYHFCRTFKQRTGLSPTQYAAKNKSYEI